MAISDANVQFRMLIPILWTDMPIG